MDVGKLDGIKVEYSNPLDCLRETLKHWLKTSCNCTWKCIFNALGSSIVGANALALEVKRKRCPQLGTHAPQAQAPHTQAQILYSQTSIRMFPNSPPAAKRPRCNSAGSSSSLSPAMARYARYLRACYTRSSLPENNKFPPSPSKHYVNLAYISRRTVSKHESEKFKVAMVRGEIDKIACDKSLDFSQVAERLQDGSYPQIVLVQGAPGVGKTTFAWEFCTKWGKGELKQEYSLVILLRLRDKRIQEAKCFRDLFYHPDGTLPDVIATELIDCLGKGVLILLEGLDELPESQWTESSVFLDLIHGRLLPLATIFITTRPWASEYLHKNCKEKISQHVEILGFTKQQIENYLQSVCKPDADPSLLSDIEKYLSCYPQIHAAMYIPLNAAIVVEVYRRSRTGECIIPKTMTELYTALSQTFLIRYLQEHPVHGKTEWKTHNFSDLPSDVCEHFLQLSEVAYCSIKNDQKLVFSSEDLPHNLETLGFMQSVPELYVNESFSHNFLHLTIQEFLAAVHITHLSPEEQMKHFKECQDGVLKVVMRFVAGLTKFSGIPSESVRALFEYEDNDPNTQYCIKCDYTVNSDHVNWMFETQDPDTMNAILGSGNTIEFYSHDLMPFDCYCLGYCIAHSHCQWKLVLQENDITYDGVRMLSAGGNDLHISKQIASIELISDLDSETQCLPEGILESLFANLSPRIRADLQELIGSGSCADFPSLIRTLKLLPSLKVLEWPNYTASSEDIKELCDLLSSTQIEIINIKKDIADSNYVTIEGIHQHTSVSVDVNADDITRTVSVLTNLGLHFTAIRVCDYYLQFGEIRDLVYQLAEAHGTATLSDQPIGTNGAMVTAKVVHIYKSLDEVDVRDDKGTCHPHMLLPPSLKEFEWTYYGARFMISMEELKELCDLLASTSNSLEIVKVRAKIEDDGYFYDSYVTIEGTYQHTSVSVDVKTSVDDVISAVSVLANLGLHFTVIRLRKSIDGNLACQLADALHNTTTLKTLELYVSHPDGTKGATGIGKLVHNNKSLEKVNVSCCKIDGKGVHHLVQALRENTTVTKLNLSGNPIGTNGALALAKVVHNKSLQNFDMSNCNIDSEGLYACHLAQSFCENTTLKELDLSHNPIGTLTKGAMALAKVMHSTSLQVVKVCSCSIDSEGAYHITQALHENTTLRRLDLSHNPIGTNGAMALMHSKSLQEVDMGHCSIDSEGLGHLARASYENTTLKKLDLSYNPIGKKGAKALAKLMRNMSLQEVTMCYCRIDSVGARHLAKALCENTTVRNLDLSGNHIGQGAVALAEMLHTNTSLQRLRLHKTRLSEEGIHKLLKAITVNSTLQLELSRHECEHYAGDYLTWMPYDDASRVMMK